MAVTVATCISEVLREFPDASVAGTGSYASIAEEMIAKADKVLAFELPLRLTTEDISLTAGTGEYATADELIARVWTARYISSASTGDSKRLIQTDITKLDLDFGDWRGQDNGEPDYFYVGASSAGAMRIGLYPFPDTATSGTYPLLRLNISKSADLVSGNSLPAMIQTSDLYVDCACWLYADRFLGMDKAEFYEARYLRRLNRARDFYFGRNAYDKQEFQFASFPSGGVI